MAKAPRTPAQIEAEKHLEPTKWKPGQSGNPAGRPKRVSMEAMVEAIMDEEVELPADPANPDSERVKIQKRELVARIFVDLLRGRNTKMLTEYLDRKWPKVHLLGGSEDHPLTLADVVRMAGDDPGDTKRKRTARKGGPAAKVKR